MESSSGFMKFNAFDMAINTSVVTRSGTPYKDWKNNKAISNLQS